MDKSTHASAKSTPKSQNNKVTLPKNTKATTANEIIHNDIQSRPKIHLNNKQTTSQNPSNQDPTKSPTIKSFNSLSPPDTQVKPSKYSAQKNNQFYSALPTSSSTNKIRNRSEIAYPNHSRGTGEFYRVVERSGEELDGQDHTSAKV